MAQFHRGNREYPPGGCPEGLAAMLGQIVKDFTIAQVDERKTAVAGLAFEHVKGLV